MALNGSFTGSTSNSTIQPKITWSATQNIGENYSMVTATLSYSRTNSGYTTSGKWSGSITINGVTTQGSTTKELVITQNSNTVAMSATVKVPHNADGSKNVAISCTGAISAASLQSTSCAATVTLDTIPRQATITSTENFTDLGNPTVYYSNPAGDAIGSLTACISLTGAKDDITYRNIPKTGTYYTFMLTDDERNLLRNNTTSGSRNVIFFVKSVIGGVTYHSTDPKTFSVVETDDTKPAVTMNLTLNNGSLPSAFNGMYIQGKSRLNVNISAQGKYSASIQSFSASIGGETYNTNSFLSNVLSKAGKVDVVGYAKDSRQFTGSAKQQIDVIEYSKPLVIPIGSETAISCYRSDGNGTRIGNSTSIWIKAKRFYYSLSGKNQCALRWRRKLVSEAWNDNTHLWKDLIPKTNTTATEYNALLSGEVFDLTKSYVIQIMATDDIGEKDIKEFEIPTQDVALHLGKGGKNVTIGTYCDYSKPYTFYSEWEAYFDKNVYAGGSKINRDVQLSSTVVSEGWYKIGTVEASMCSVTTITIGGEYYYDNVTPSMVDIATHYNVAKAYLRLPALLDTQISKLGITKESELNFGIYVYYNSSNMNYVTINVHSHMGEFHKVNLEASNLTDADLIETINLKS